MPDKFTYRQEKAINCLLSGMTHSDSYRAAYSTDNMKSQTVRRKAHMLFTLPKVKARIEKEKQLSFQRNHATLDEVLGLMADSLRVDPLEAFDETGAIKPLKDIPVAVRRAMGGIKIEEKDGGMFGSKTTIKDIKFNPKVPIMDMFLKKFGDYAAAKLQVEDVTPISKKITAEEAADIDKKLDEQY